MPFRLWAVFQRLPHRDEVVTFLGEKYRKVQVFSCRKQNQAFAFLGNVKILRT